MAETRPLRISEAARIMGVSVSSVKRYIEDGHLTPLILPGGHRRIPVEQIDKYFAQAGERRRKALSRSKPRRPAQAPQSRREPRKPRRERRASLGSPPPAPVYDTSDEALAEIRSRYEDPTAKPAA